MRTYDIKAEGLNVLCENGINLMSDHCEGLEWFYYETNKKLLFYNSDTEAPFLDLHLSVANGFVSSKIYGKRDDFDFDIVNFPFFNGFWRSSSCFLWCIHFATY